MILGAQLYTVRDYMKNLEDFSETLKKIADIGYTCVQVSGSCAYEPQWLAKELRSNGLTCALTHINPEKIAFEPDTVCDEHDIFDCGYIGIGHYNIKEIGIEAFHEKFAPAAKTFLKRGKHLLYHNHDGEFEKLDGRLIIDWLLDSFSPEELGIILDTYWVQYGGGDPIEWIYKLKGRVPCIHFKDMGFKHAMLPIGEGNMNFSGILKACEEVKPVYCLIEQDDCHGEDPFSCLKKSYEYLKSEGLK